MDDDKLHEQIQTKAIELTELLETYSKDKRLSQPKLTKLLLMLLEYWSLDNNLASASRCSQLVFEIEEEIIKLGKEYDN